MAEYKAADKHLIQMAQELIDEFHPWLKNARIGFMWRKEAPSSNSRTILGKARKVSDEQKVFLDYDFVIWIAKDKFDQFELAQRRALVDHELCHCGWSDGECYIRKHDVEEFNIVIQRHGFWQDGLKPIQLLAIQPQLPGTKVTFSRAGGVVESVPSGLLEKAMQGDGDALDTVADQLFEAGKALKAENGGEITVSQLQRKLGIGTSMAAQIKDLLDQVAQ